MSDWKEEFGEDYDVPQEITDKYEDISWHNDSSPSFRIMHENDINPKIAEDGSVIPDPDREPYYWLAVWVEHPDKDMRELDLARYEIVLHGDSIDGMSLGSSEELDEEFMEKLSIVEKYAKAHGLAHLARYGMNEAKPTCSCGNRNMASMGKTIICDLCYLYCGEIPQF